MKPLERHNRELAILNSIAAALNASVELDESLRAALSRVAELLDLRTGWVFLLDETTGEARLVASQNLPPGLARHPERFTGSCYCLDTYRQGDLGGAANVNVVTCSRLKGLVDGADGLRYHASIPLYARGRKLGIMNVASPEWRELSPEDLRLLYTIGDLLAIAIERARLFERSAEAGAAEERNRIAREIHDTLAQGLAGIALQLEAAEALLEAGSPPDRVADAVRRALDETRQSLDEARRSVLDLRATPLEDASLADAVRTLSAAWSRTHGIPVEVHGTVDMPLAARIEVGLYRIAQESLTNIARHAASNGVVITLSADASRVRLVVQDDGRGFDPAAVLPGRFGLSGMSERARLLGGSLRVESEPESGTRVLAEVPLGPQPVVQ
jgi:two-component system NarL family sensor kinase